MRDRRLSVMFGALLSIAMLWALPLNTLAKGLSYEGSATIGATVIPEAVRVFEAQTGIPFDKVGIAGSSQGFKAVMAGEVVLGGMSRALKKNERKAKPYYQIIGYDGVGIFVHANNPVQALSKEQLKGIFTGRITNWQAVGGKDAPITVVIADKAHGTVQEFQKDALSGAAYQATKEFPDPSDCVAFVAKDEQAITAAALAFNVAGTKVLGVDNAFPAPESVKVGSYPFSRPLLLITKGLPQADVKQFFDFMLSAAGQQIVAKYFVPVK